VIRVAFTLIGGKNWTGGYNYLLNLVRVLGEHQPGQLVPVLFFGTDTDESEAAPFAQVPGAEIVRTPLMNQSRKARSLAISLVMGCDSQVRALFRQHGIDVVFESAQFFGARLGIPSIAWIPDFQHRVLPHLFTRAGYWKRELGFRAQVAGGRTIMLSSEDSRLACERYYPATIGRTHTVRFAVPVIRLPTPAEALAIADAYGLPADYVFLPNQFWKHKNHLLVVRALALLRDRGRPVVVAASGKQLDPRNPEHFGEVKAAIESSGLSDSFRLLGMLPYEHVAPLACASVALLNPSHFEGWSTTVEEARSLGVPMLLSDLPVHREQAGINALYFDRHSAVSLADALQSLQRCSPVDRGQRTSGAQADTVHRIQRFAVDFVAVVNQTIDGHS